MESDYAAVYADLYRTHWWWRSREALVIREIRGRVPSGGWRHALDVGCGDGLFLPALSRFASTVEGLEVDGSLVSEKAAARHVIHIGALDGDFAPSRTFDFISMLDVLEHMERPLPALRRAREIMSPGGVLLVTVPAFQALWTRHDDINQHCTRYTRAGLTALVGKAGFETVKSRYFFHWLTLPKWILGRLERRFGTRVDQARLPNAALNALLYTVTRAEQAVSGPFGGFPGSSLLLVAAPRS